MKKHYLIIFGIVLCLLKIQTSGVFAQQQYIKLPSAFPIPIQSVFYELTPQDKLNYVLSAGQPIKIKYDTFVYKLDPNAFRVYQEKQNQMIVPVKLTNNSNDTLEYIGMECSWWDIYLTNNSKIEIEPANDGCYKNGPTVIKLAPDDSSVIDVPVGCVEDVDTKFRIGMIVQKYDGKSLDIPMFQRSNTIWSNEIGIP